jgi:hypothetical protein
MGFFYSFFFKTIYKIHINPIKNILFLKYARANFLNLNKLLKEHIEYLTTKSALCIKIEKKILFVLFTTTHLLFPQPKDSTITVEMYQVYEIDINKNYLYKKPHLFDFVTKLPRDFIGTIKDCGKKENLIALSCAAITTVVLLPYDQQALYESWKIGERIGLDEDVTYDKVANITIVTPNNITSSLFICDSKATPIALGIGFATYGLFKNDYRSLHTASGLVESTIITGIFSQTFKRISGRQEPHVTMETGNPEGKWSPFPGLDEYEDDPTNYSSFSSGHIMTATAALYVITGNYPEYK